MERDDDLELPDFLKRAKDEKPAPLAIGAKTNRELVAEQEKSKPATVAEVPADIAAEQAIKKQAGIVKLVESQLLNVAPDKRNAAKERARKEFDKLQAMKSADVSRVPSVASAPAKPKLKASQPKPKAKPAPTPKKPAKPEPPKPAPRLNKLKAQGTSAERQTWLEKSHKLLVGKFNALGFKVPDNLRTSVGFPHGGRKGAHAIGQCWGPQASADGFAELFISPELGVTSDKTAKDESVFLLSVQAHEIAHAIVGVEAKHGKPFKDCATKIGLEGKMTATIPGEAFKLLGADIVAKLGTFPMGKLTKASRIGKQTTRLLKCECIACGYVARITRKWIDEAGTPICPTDSVPMICDDTTEA